MAYSPKFGPEFKKLVEANRKLVPLLLVLFVLGVLAVLDSLIWPTRRTTPTDDAAAKAMEAAANRYSDEQKDLLRRIKDFDWTPYKAQFDALGSVDTDGKNKVISDCSKGMRQIYNSIKFIHRWTANISLDRCTYEAIARNAPFCTNTESDSITPNSIEVNFSFDYSESRTTFDAGRILPTDPVYPTLLKLKDNSEVLFTGDDLSPFASCDERDLTDVDLPTHGLLHGSLSAHYVGFHLQSVEPLPY